MQVTYLQIRSTLQVHYLQIRSTLQVQYLQIRSPLQVPLTRHLVSGKSLILNSRLNCKLDFRFFLYCTACQHPAQNASTQRHPVNNLILKIFAFFSEQDKYDDLLVQQHD